jgi:hypothetical protein
MSRIDRFIESLVYVVISITIFRVVLEFLLL